MGTGYSFCNLRIIQVGIICLSVPLVDSCVRAVSLHKHPPLDSIMVCMMSDHKTAGSNISFSVKWCFIMLIWQMVQFLFSLNTVAMTEFAMNYGTGLLVIQCDWSAHYEFCDLLLKTN